MVTTNTILTVDISSPRAAIYVRCGAGADPCQAICRVEAAPTFCHRCNAVVSLPDVAWRMLAAANAADGDTRDGDTHEFLGAVPPDFASDLHNIMLTLGRIADRLDAWDSLTGTSYLDAKVGG